MANLWHSLHASKDKWFSKQIVNYFSSIFNDFSSTSRSSKNDDKTNWTARQIAHSTRQDFESGTLRAHHKFMNSLARVRVH